MQMGILELSPPFKLLNVAGDDKNIDIFQRGLVSSKLGKISELAS